ncbi:MFS transporter, partial [Streptomyces sp. SID7982]|nr:MFS transporter [Streptomyces sp. SID7982]
LFGAIGLRLPRPDTRTSRDGDPDGREGTGGLRALAEPFRSPVVLRFLILSFCLALIYLQKQSSLPLDMRAQGLGPDELGLVLSLNGVLIICTQPLVSRLSGRLGLDTQFGVAAVLVAVGFGANAVVGTAWGYAAALALWTFGEILLVPQASAFLVRHAPAGRTGSYQGAYYFVWNLGLVLGAPLGMAVLQSWGPEALWGLALLLGLAVVAVHVVAAKDRPAPR